MVYIILGMHKSGTTLVSQILHHSGINMLDDVDVSISYDQGNKYERVSANCLNEEILGCLGVESLDIAAPEKLEITDAQQARMKEIIHTCNQKYGTAWGFKDPRTTLTYPLWADELPDHKLIVIYRNLEELWQHYHSKQRIRDRFLKPGLAWRLMERWCEHNANILAILKHTQVDFLLLEYQKLMLDSQEFERLQDFIGIELEDRRRLDLYRHRSSDTNFSMKLAAWSTEKKIGYHPNDIAQQLDMLIREQVN